METKISNKKKAKAPKPCEALKLNMTTAEFEAYIHKIEAGVFMSVSESKTAFFKWMDGKQ